MPTAPAKHRPQPSFAAAPHECRCGHGDRRSNLRRRLPGADGVLHALLDRDDRGIAESGHMCWNACEMRGLERTRLPKPVARRMAG